MGGRPWRGEKIDLWELSGGPHLRGANIFLTRVYPELDRHYKGPGPIGPPYTQADFDRLAGLGANVVNISMPGLFSEEPPWELDLDVQGTLDDLLEMIRRANMFAVIGARTGPGRNEFSFHSTAWSRGVDMSDHSLWETTAAQQAWIDMWRYTAARYRDDPIVVGYYLMVEPHASEAVAGLEAEEFYARYEGTLVDWNQLYPRIVEAVREEDERTPVIVDAEGWSGLAWLSYHPPAPDERIVYSFHQYLPLHYTIGPLTDHPYGDLVVVYRGEADLDGDGDSEMFDERWMDSLLAPADRFMAERDARLTVNELGVVRWVPEGHAFMRDQLELLEARGMNHAIWLWNASFEMWEGQTDAFGLQFGPDLVPGRDRASEELLDAVSDIWMRNTERPWLDSPERTAN